MHFNADSMTHRFNQSNCKGYIHCAKLNVSKYVLCKVKVFSPLKTKISYVDDYFCLSTLYCDCSDYVVKVILYNTYCVPCIADNEVE